MKAKSIILGPGSVKPGHHKSYNLWHDTDHRIENHGCIEHIYYSQRFVALPEYMEARKGIDLEEFPDGGPQYLAIYWSTSDAATLANDARVLFQKLSAAGRNIPFTQDMQFSKEAVAKSKLLQEWNYSIPIVCAKREGLSVAAEAIPLYLHKGIVFFIGTILDAEAGAEWNNWYLNVHVPDVLKLPGFLGFFKFMPSDPSAQKVYSHMFYVDMDPLECLRTYWAAIPKWRDEGRYPDELIEKAQKNWMTSPFKTVEFGHYDKEDIGWE